MNTQRFKVFLSCSLFTSPLGYRFGGKELNTTNNGADQTLSSILYFGAVSERLQI